MCNRMTDDEFSKVLWHFQREYEKIQREIIDLENLIDRKSKRKVQAFRKKQKKINSKIQTINNIKLNRCNGFIPCLIERVKMGKFL